MYNATVLTDDKIKELLVSDSPYDRISALGHILAGDAPSENFREDIEALENSDVPSMFGMTEGDIASLTLAATGVKPYTGNNETVMAQLAMM